MNRSPRMCDSSNEDMNSTISQRWLGSGEGNVGLHLREVNPLGNWGDFSRQHWVSR